MSNLTIQDKINLIKNGIFYEEFATDEEFDVRYFTAKAGKYLNILVNDYNYYIRFKEVFICLHYLNISVKYHVFRF